jgi:hypothetical protein
MTNLDERISAATQFIEHVDLPRASSSARAGEDFSARIKPVNSQQSLAIGHGIVTFVPQMPSRKREAVANSFLLAQLAADKRASAGHDLDEWYRAFFEALTHIGWLIEHRDFNEYTTRGEEVETHQAILGIAAALLGSGTAAYLLVKATLDALGKLNQEDWIVLFRTNSQSRTGELFQIAVAEPDEQGNTSIKLMAFQIAAKSTRTGVLFFKWGIAEATLRYFSGKVTYTTSIADHVAGLIAERVRSYTADYVTNLEI